MFCSSVLLRRRSERVAGWGSGSSQGQPLLPKSLVTTENFQVSCRCSICHIHQGLNGYLYFLPAFLGSVAENFNTFFTGLHLLEILQVFNEILELWKTSTLCLLRKAHSDVHSVIQRLSIKICHLKWKEDE